MSEDKLRAWIAERPALNWSELSRQINWAVTSFHEYMSGKRKMPIEKKIALEEHLSDLYGYD